MWIGWLGEVGLGWGAWWCMLGWWGGRCVGVGRLRCGEMNYLKVLGGVLGCVNWVLGLTGRTRCVQ